MQEKVFDMIMKEEEVSWRTILYDLVKSEEMDPWDLNITLLTHKYIDLIKNLQEHNLRISGKVLLAAAFLLKLKSAHLLDTDITRLDALLNQTEEDLKEELLGEMESVRKIRDKDKYHLIPKNPQPRTRKVSIHDLVDALQKAMESKKRVLAKIRPVKFQMPKKGVDIMEVIKEVYQKVVYYSEKDKKKKIPFSRLLPPRPGKEEKVFTFIPLLHLENLRKLDLEQAQPFADISVQLLKKRAK